MAHAGAAAHPFPQARLAPQVATLVLLLASQRLSNVTGSIYVTDGGLLKTI
jgi:enoyl-[acyl-carrier-protein] reductase (NADH)